MNLDKAIYIKPILIQHLIKNNPNIVFGNEIRFGSQDLFADLISISKKHVSAYEVKAKKDDLRNIIHQLNNYKKVFDYIFLVVTENHFNHVMEIINERIGVILITNDGRVKTIRNAKLSSSQTKIEILHSITLKFLLKINSTKGKNIKSSLRCYLQRKTLSELKKQYLMFLLDKLEYRNLRFRKEIGKIIHIEDVSILSYFRNVSVYK